MKHTTILTVYSLLILALFSATAYSQQQTSPRKTISVDNLGVMAFPDGDDFDSQEDTTAQDNDMTHGTVIVEHTDSPTGADRKSPSSQNSDNSTITYPGPLSQSVTHLGTVSPRPRRSLSGGMGAERPTLTDDQKARKSFLQSLDLADLECSGRRYSQQAQAASSSSASAQQTPQSDHHDSGTSSASPSPSNRAIVAESIAVQQHAAQATPTNPTPLAWHQQIRQRLQRLRELRSQKQSLKTNSSHITSQNPDVVITIRGSTPEQPQKKSCCSCTEQFCDRMRSMFKR